MRGACFCAALRQLHLLRQELHLRAKLRHLTGMALLWFHLVLSALAGLMSASDRLVRIAQQLLLPVGEGSSWDAGRR